MTVVPKVRFEGAPRGASYEAWREEFCRKIISCDLSPVGEGTFIYEVSPRPLTASVMLSSGGGSPLSYKTLGGDDKLVLLMPDSSPLDMHMGNRETLLMPGQVSFGDSAIGGATVIQTAAGGFHSIVFDRKTLLACCPAAEDLVARPAAIDPATLGLLRTYIDSLNRQPHHFNAATASVVGQHLLDLTVLMLGGNGDLAKMAESGGVAAACFEIVKADILAQVSNPDLNIAILAARHRFSVRYFQYLFERAGTSFTEFVLEQRLLLAMRLLANPLHSHRKIADISLMSGFNSISYFHRAFRQRFDMTPTQARVAMAARKD